MEMSVIRASIESDKLRYKSKAWAREKYRILQVQYDLTLLVEQFNWICMTNEWVKVEDCGNLLFERDVLSGRQFNYYLLFKDIPK